MQRPPAEAIAFLAPGLVHQFGNLLLTIQGHALGLGERAAGDRGAIGAAPGPATLGRSREAILHASERGGRSLQLLRRLLGETEACPTDARELLAELVELARVPVRDHRQSIELVGAESGGAEADALWVEAGGCAQLFGVALLALMQVVPDGVRGLVRVSLRRDGTELCLGFTFAALADSLPFPVSMRAVADEVTAFAGRRGLAAACVASPSALELRLPELRQPLGFDRRLGLAES
ncbi:MAG: hypothetical protein MUC36_14770 [Planctomycetes bacterium]|nr:hypothetical protein [Planctomycetota bacterium]